MGWASSHTPEGHRFDSRSGHMPRLQFNFWMGHSREKQPIDISPVHQSFCTSLSPSLPVSLKIKINKIFFKKLYKFQVYSSTKHHLRTASCAHCPKHSLFLSPFSLTLPSSTHPHSPFPLVSITLLSMSTGYICFLFNKWIT